MAFLLSKLFAYVAPVRSLYYVSNENMYYYIYELSYKYICAGIGTFTVLIVSVSVYNRYFRGATETLRHTRTWGCIVSFPDFKVSDEKPVGRSGYFVHCYQCIV